MVLRTGSFFKNLKAARGKLGSFSSGIGSLGGKLKSFITPLGAATAGLAGLAGIGGSLAMGVKLAAEMETASIAFEMLLKDGDKAKAFLSDLSKFAASTPFQLPELREGAQKLLAFGFSADEVMQQIKVLGDVAAATGKPIGEYIGIVGRAKAGGGFIQTSDINMLADRGVPVYDLLAKQLGVTAIEIKKMASTSKLSLADVQTALQTVTSEGNIFHGAMAKQSTSLSGLFSTLKDNVSFVLMELGQLLISEFNFKDILGNVTEFAQNSLAKIQEWSPAIKASFGVVKAIIFSLGEQIKVIWDAVSAYWGPIISKFLPDFTSGFSSWQDFIVSALVAVEYGLKNWRTLAQRSFLSVYLSVIKFAENFKHFFTAVLPQVIVNYVKFQIANFKGLIKNIGEVIKYIKSLGKHKIQFTPPDFSILLEGIPARERTALEQTIQDQIGAIDANMGSGFSDFLQQRKKELGLLKKPAEEATAAIEPAKQLDLWGAITGKVKAYAGIAAGLAKAGFEGVSKFKPEQHETKFASAALRGTAEARTAILKHQFGKSEKDEVAVNTKAIAKGVDAMLSWWKNKGIEEQLQPV